VLTTPDGSKAPFLRGILTRSLQKCGLSFDEAHEVASVVRSRLSRVGEIEKGELRTFVAEQLEEQGFLDHAKAYLQARQDVSRIRVVTSDGAEGPFSKSQLADSLEICALSREELHELASQIELDLLSASVAEVSTSALTERVLEALENSRHPASAEDYRRWVEFSHSGRPLVLLIGGTTGSGKSTVGAELAHSLDIVRTQSTDMLREIMRLLVPERLVPTLHTSSFEAFEQVPMKGEGDGYERMLSGYLTQSSQVRVGIEGVLNRTQNEGVSLIIEGVHLHPQMMSEIAQNYDLLVIPVVLAVLKEKRLKKRLVGRGHIIQSRRSERYIQHFEHIWELQSFLLDEAETHDIPIIPNNDEEATVRSILQAVSAELKRLEKEGEGT